MKTKIKKYMKACWITLGLCVVNATIVLAQPVEIVVTGGGFIIHGPSTINFPEQAFSFQNQTSILNFKDIPNPGPAYLEISDENGGSPFSVALGAEDLTPGGSGICNPERCIPKANLAVKNNDGISPNITTIEGSESYVFLDPSTNFYNDPPASLSQQRILLNGTGAAPGTWRIYPQLQETTPGNTATGNYAGTITITIMTT